MAKLSVHCWGFIDGYGDGFEHDRIISMRDEEDARLVAELFPDNIYFFADEVPHPNS